MRKAILPLLLLVSIAAFSQGERIALDGTWQFAFDPQASLSATSPMNETVTLPGTTDTNKKGVALQNHEETTHLSRLFSYAGRAWYRREVNIPKSWKKKCITLTLERTKPAEVYIDGWLAGRSDDICTPQRYDLTTWLTPGRHVIAIMVDNDTSLPPQLLSNSHACTEDTQTNWNGIIGEISLSARNSLHFTDVQVRPIAKDGEVEVTFSLQGKVKNGATVHLFASPELKNGEVTSAVVWLGKKEPVAIKFPEMHDKAPLRTYVTTMPLKGEKALWDEFSPDRYVLTAQIDGVDTVTVPFGLTDFRVDGPQFNVNGRRTFLRGKHDACVFPLTAHVPMDVDAWTDYLLKNKEYGINHVRFHSWCPPEAAFEAADRLGIYLQPELPFWGDFNPADERLMTFLHKEGEHIIHEYGHHPSFVMFALGNELWGSVEKMGEFVADFRKLAPDKLFTFGSNYYLGYQGVKPGMDYFTTCRVGGEAWGTFDTHTRGSFSFADTYDGGLINHTPPNTKMNFEKACSLSTVPVISHETAQFQTYPDYDEIRKYKGVLYPYNQQMFYKRLVQAGMADQAKDFHRASGLWSLQLYKADVEMDLRTPNMAGFQLLDLQDYPGQGSAYVGVLDAFMDEKLFMRESGGGDMWKSFCAPVVPMVEMEKFCFSNNERLRGRLLLSNYGSGKGDDAWRDGLMKWRLMAGGKVLCEGQKAIPEQCSGLVAVGEMDADLSGISRATRCELVLEASLDNRGGTVHTNSYPVWVYPSDNDLEGQKKGIVITHCITPDIARRLEQGASILLMPDTAEWKGHYVGGLFQTDYWNYRMFKTISENNHRPVSPGTPGILTRPEHPLFADFPTDAHTSWQWFPVVKASYPMILDNLPTDYRPVVQVIDNIERNHRLGLVFEFAVGKGRLLVCMSDLEKAAERVEGRQFYLSLLRYMHSPDFQPTTRYSYEQLSALLRQPIKERKLEELNNISPY